MIKIFAEILEKHIFDKSFIKALYDLDGIDYEDDKYPELPIFGKYNSTGISRKKLASPTIEPQDFARLEREPSTNERYRDYSPGNFVIKTTSMPFNGIHFKGVQNMFNIDDSNFTTQSNVVDHHHKLIIDTQL